MVRPEDRPRVRRTLPRTPPSRRLEDGDKVCGDCGEGNPATRRFCSRCGGALDTAQVVHIPWYRRIFRRRQRPVPTPSGDGNGGGGPTPPAQRRRRQRPIGKIIRRTIALILLVGGLLYATVPDFRSYVYAKGIETKNAVVNAVMPQYPPVRPIETTATGQIPKHEAVMATDGFTNTYWACPVAGPQHLSVKFQEPVRPRRLLIRAGIIGNFQGSNRPKKLHLVYPNGKSDDVSLADNTDPQELKIDPGEPIGSIEIQIVELYVSTQSREVAISEIEFFYRD